MAKHHLVYGVNMEPRTVIPAACRTCLTINEDNEGHHSLAEAKKCSDDAEYTKLKGHIDRLHWKACSTGGEYMSEVYSSATVAGACMTSTPRPCRGRQASDVSDSTNMCGWLRVMSCLHHNIPTQ